MHLVRILFRIHGTQSGRMLWRIASNQPAYAGRSPVNSAWAAQFCIQLGERGGVTPLAFFRACRTLRTNDFHFLNRCQSPGGFHSPQCSR